jgi:hypothetical protein
MSERNTVVRSLHDLGLAAWFGGSLIGAVGFNGEPAEVPEEKLRLRVANAAWARWTPVNLVAIGAHLVGAGAVTREQLLTRTRAGQLGRTAWERPPECAGEAAKPKVGGASIAGGGPLDDAVGYGCWHIARLLVSRGAYTRLWHAAALASSTAS